VTAGLFARVGALESGVSSSSALLILVLAVCNTQIDVLFGEIQAAETGPR